MPLQLSLITVISVLFVLAGSSQADIVSPIGLNPGDAYRIVFVTQGTLDATSSDIADYDAFVTSQANMAGSITAQLATNWRVIGSTPTVDAKIHTATDDSPSGINGVPIFLVDGSTKIADDYDDLWDGAIDASISLDQDGDSRSALSFTGTQSTGNVDPSNPLGGEIVVFGSTERDDFGWVRGGGAGGTSLRALYAISDELTVAAVPEPSSFASFGFVVLGIVGRRRRRSRCTH